MQLAAGFCRRWLIILHCCASLRSHGVCGVRVWVSGSGAGAAQPTLLQCSSAFHWLTLQLCLCAAPRPLKNTSRWRSTGGSNATQRSFPPTRLCAGADGVSFSPLSLSSFPTSSSYCAREAKHPPNSHCRPCLSLSHSTHTCDVCLCTYLLYSITPFSDVDSVV